ncbi:hypothetical protein DIC82_03785 [Clostridium beijerinckii]|nr:hypothetical protein DIC82_03785 [Clostridium beijerinckii]
MEELLNKKVIHEKFGIGVIINAGDEKIIVKFDKLAENKKFEYPNGFECFLKFENKLLQESMLKQLRDKRERDAIEKVKIRLEYERQHEECKKEELELARKKRKAAKAKEEKK